jgi:16S rRNA (adenine1518-N6/adenine1519-N6)-dimethyltransferase
MADRRDLKKPTDSGPAGIGSAPINPKPRLDRDAKRHAFGQHFLRDPEIIHGICDATFSNPPPRGEKYTVLEIGPGKGAITDRLIDECKRREYPLYLVEKDFYFADSWKAKGVNVFSADFLHWDLETFLREHPTLRVVSNLPYSAGTAIFLELTKYSKNIPWMFLMFQAEVGKRLRADASDSDRGSLSVWTQNFWEVGLELKVPPKAFSPPPKVDSEVLWFKARSEPLFAGTWPGQPGYDELEKFLKAAFTQPRKMMRVNFKPYVRYLDALKKAGVDETLRAGALTNEQWVSIWNTLV